MFDNIGSKCKTVAKVVCWIGIIGSVIVGFVLITTGLNLSGGASELYLALGLLTLAVGSLISWLSTLALYALGEIAENGAIVANLAVKADMERQKAQTGE